MLRTVKIAGNIICIIAAAVITAVLLMMVLHIRPAIVMSGSMEPEIHVGSIALIDTRHRDAEEGDIIAFKKGEAFITHRVIRVTGDGFETKGDANDSPDPGLVSESQIEGRTIGSVPGAGYVIHAFKTPGGIAAMICILLIMIIGNFSGRENRERESTS